MGERSGKKRKHTADDGERPHKRPALESSAQTVKLSMVPNVNEWVPAIVTAPGLEIPNDVTFKVYEKPRRNSALRARSAGRTPFSETEILLNSSTHPRLFYTGREENVENLDGVRKNYVAVYDPKTGDLQVVPARLLVIRAMLQSPATQEPDNEGLDEQSSARPLSNARTDLGQAFGTKKSQKAIQSRIDNAITTGMHSSQVPTGEVDLNPLASAVIDSMAKGAVFASREDLRAETDQAKPKPKANLEAKTPADVYKIEDLMSIDALTAINVTAWQDAVRENRDVQTKSLYVSKRLQRLAQLGDLTKLKVLRYLLLLLDWNRCLTKLDKGAWKLPSREAVKNAVGDDVNEFVLENVRKQFAERNIMNKFHRDKLSMYACALALIIDNYDVDMHDLREDLRLDLKDITQYFRELGCTSSVPTDAERKALKISHIGRASHKMARLRIPLDFPKKALKVLSKKRT